MAVIVDIDHEGGDLTEYTSTVTDSGDLSVQAAAALAGTDYGLQCVIDDTTGIYGEYNLVTPDANPAHLRMRFYLDVNSLTMGDGNNFILVVLVNSSLAGIGRVYLNYASATGYALTFSITNDSAAEDYIGSSSNITDAPHYIECRITRSSTADANDGSAEWWIDGVSIASETGKDIYTRMADFDMLRIGAYTGLEAETSGTLFFDQLVVRDDATEIGPVSTGDASVTAVVATASAAGVAPALAGNGAVTGTVGTGIAAGVSPSVTGDVTVTAVAVSAAAAGIGPSLSGAGSVTSVVTGAPAAMVAPAVTGSSAAQKKYPVSDTYVGNWTTNTGATTNLFDALNETSYSDTDYIKSEESPSSSPCVVKLDNLADPESSTGHILRYRYGKEGQQNINIAVQLRQGYTNEASPGTLIKEWSHTNVSALTTAEQTLSGAEADSITDYTSLFVRMVGSTA